MRDNQERKESYALLAVDAAYVHSGARKDCMNSWSEEELENLRPRRIRSWLEKQIGIKINKSLWCGAKDGRLDSGGARMEKKLVEAKFELRFRRIKVDEVKCRRRHCNCIHKTEPVLVRRQAGVDVDLATRTLELILRSKAKWSCVVLVAGDGDFVPLVESLKRNHCDFYVAAFPASLSPELQELAEDVFDLSKSKAWKATKIIKGGGKKTTSNNVKPTTTMSFLYTSDDGSVSSDDEEDDEPDIEDDEKDKEVESKRSLSLEESNEYYEEDVVVASDNDADLSANDKKFVPQLVQESQSTTLTHQHDVLDSACSDDDNEIILFQPTSAASHPLAISHLEISSFCTTSTSNSGDADDGEFVM